MSLRKRLLITIAAMAIASPLHAQPPAAKMRLGMNANWNGGVQVDGKFADDTTIAPWTANGAPVTGALPVGAVRNAWITTYPGARTLKATGKGTLSVFFANGFKDAGNLIKTNAPNLFTATFTGTEVYTFTPNSGGRQRIGLTVQATDATAPLGSVQVLAPGASGRGLYHPNYLAALSPFAVIRTMDPQQIVGSKEIRWADRNTQYGQDLEALIALGNQLDRDLWICVPHGAVSANGAATDWCYSLGDLLNALCGPDRTIYLEYSDEIWNYGNPFWIATSYVAAQAGREYEALGYRQAYARAAHKAFQAVSSRIGPYGPKLKRVCAGQLGNIGTIDPSLPWAVAQGYRFDALAAGFYWPLKADTAAIKAAWAAGDQAGALKLVDDGFRAGADQMMAWVKPYAVYAQRYGMELVGYEGGPGMGLWADPAGLPIMQAYVRSPLCKQQHLDTLQALEAAGVSLLCYYSYAHPDPTWSARLSADDLTNGRYRALLHHTVGAPPALYAGADSTTRGNWQGAYGSLGATIAAAPPAILPPGVTPLPGPAITGKSYTYQATTTDPRALQLADGSGNRVAAAWIDPLTFTVDVPGPTDGGQYLLSLYVLDWANYAGGVTETISILSGDGAKTLDSKSVSGLSTTPLYLKWAVEGHVKVRIDRTAGGGAILSGVFLDPVPSP